MESENPLDQVAPEQTLRMRWVAWRNGILSSQRFQNWAARNVLLRPFARRKANDLFDLVAGFTYTQTLLAMIESGLLDSLQQGACTTAAAAQVADLSPPATRRLLKSALGIGLVEEVDSDLWMLGQRGASLVPQEGAKAMVRHHSLLYRDLADPLALLRQDRAEPTQLSEFWRYAAREDAVDEGDAAVSPYSQLMAASQAMVASEVLQAFNFRKVSSLLDVGGGHGAFASAVAAKHPSIELAIFDLPGVLEGTSSILSRSDLAGRIALHGGNFFKDELPGGYDAISLIRILHDHDDDPAQSLLDSARRALAKDGRLLIAEPMSDASGAAAMGETYFGMYLWAMRSGRPRRSDELIQMLEKAGFSSAKRLHTAQPMVTSVIVATA
ncbi:Demethylspheroidene O-methyltransferase [Altererythrobacter insulae]|nr:Demethylspheroidene O-methyltransferase [Altererythrobacter insulae]